MNKFSKTIVCALFIPAVPAFALPAADPMAVRNVAVTSVMTDRLSKTAAGLSAAQEAGDDARAEAILNKIFAGGNVKVSATPVYAAAPAEVPVSRAAHYAVTIEELAPEIPGADAPAAVTPAAAAVPAVSAETPDAEDTEAAKKKEEDAKALKEFKSGFYITLISLLLILLLL